MNLSEMTCFSLKLLKLFKRETTRLLRTEKAKRQPNLKDAEDELSRLDKQISNMVDAIKQGAFSSSLKTELDKAESEREMLKNKLTGRDIKTLEKIGDFLPRAVDRYKKIVDYLPTALQRDVIQARHQIKSLLGDKIILNPVQESYLEAELIGNYAGLITMASNNSLKIKEKVFYMPGGGFEPPRTLRSSGF